MQRIRARCVELGHRAPAIGSKSTSKGPTRAGQRVAGTTPANRHRTLLERSTFVRVAVQLRYRLHRQHGELKRRCEEVAALNLA